MIGIPDCPWGISWGLSLSVMSFWEFRPAFIINEFQDSWKMKLIVIQCCKRVIQIQHNTNCNNKAIHQCIYVFSYINTKIHITICFESVEIALMNIEKVRLVHACLIYVPHNDDVDAYHFCALWRNNFLWKSFILR